MEDSLILKNELFENYNQENFTFDINNRKYIGSKFKLLKFIERIILSKLNRIDIFIDGFAGTGVVANYFKKYAKKIISNDILFSNYIINKVFLNSTKRNVSINKIRKLIFEFNIVKPSKGYIFNNYGGTYFTYENAGLMDTIREKIEDLYLSRECTEQEKYVLLTSLLFAIDKVANTVGQYDAFLKNIGKSSYSKNGKHLIDSNVYKRLQLKVPKITYDGNNKVYNKDLNILIKRIKGDVLYLDPPYNNRQYIDCYHVLENIMRWNKPKLYGKTRKFYRNNLKSKYSRKKESITAFKELITDSKVEHIFLSYNNEGIMADKDIIEILKQKGKVEIFEEKYRIFGNGAGRSRKRIITERLFYCKVN